MKLTDAQCEIIDHRGSSLVVSASAGSGKTEVLARRCVALIADAADPCPVDRMLVVTFTRAAAAELRARIAGMLRGARDETRDSALGRHLQRQSVLLNAAEIGTIDSWCSRLVRENFSHCGVDPAFAVLSSEDDHLLQRAALNDLLEWIFSAADADARLGREWIGRNMRPSADFLRDAVCALHEFRDHLVDDQGWHAEQLAVHSRPADELKRDAARQISAATAQECAFQTEQLRAVVIAAEDQRVRRVLSDYGKVLQTWSGPLCDPQQIADRAAEIDEFSFPRRPPKLPEADVRRWEDVRDRWLKKRLQANWGAESIQPVLENAPRAAELAALLLRLEARLNEAITVEKRRRSAFGFGDIQRLALRVLRAADGTPSPVAQRLREHYRHVLVDEVQDTSPVQFELLRLVSHDAPGRSNGFLVGDVKQSIYGFREAEPQLFADIINAIRAGTRDGRAVVLTDNFRSHDRLVRAVNGIFTGLFDTTLGGVTLDDAAQLRARRAEIENPPLDGEPRVELHILPTREPKHDESEENDEESDGSDIPLERVEREAAIAADRIHVLMRNGAIPDQLADGTLRLRPVRLGDIVVLLRSARGNAPLAAAALRGAGVAAIAVGRESMIDSREVGDVRNILALIGNRRQDLALAAYLRGPFVELTPSDLLAIRNTDADVPFHEAVLRAATRADPLAGKVRATLSRIDRLTAAARHIDLPELVRAIIHEGDLKHFARALPGGEHRVAMLEALEDFADAFAASGGGASEFVEHLAALETEELKPFSAAASADDVVRVMTIHASKGLEFPIVIMLNCGAEFSRRPRDVSLKADERLGIGLSFYDYPARAELATAAHPILQRRQAARDLDEELRLLYVAATRAREKLIFIGHGEHGRWAAWKSRGAAGGPPPLIDRLTAASALDWLMMGIAASDPRGELNCVAVHGEAGTETGAESVGLDDAMQAAAEPQAGPAESRDALSTADQQWVAESARLIRATIDDTGSRRPAALSVSVLKDEAADAARAHRWIDSHETELRLPDFAGASRADGRDRDTATHRYLQFADHRVARDLPAVGAELDRLIRQGRISRDAANLVDLEQLAWLAATPLGRECAAAGARCRREVAFVYALPTIGGAEPTLVRGMIDCILERDNGLSLIDYKTDRPADANDLAARVAGYETQVRFYALAAASVFQQPVHSAHLVFLSERRVFDVSVSPADLERLLTQMDAALQQFS